jgi:Uma2 family endonuclease
MQDELRPAPRYELIDGELIVSPSPGVKHQFAVRQLVVRLHEFVEREGLGTVLMSPADVELAPESVTQPDVFVVPRGTWGDAEGPMQWSSISSLLLAIEVISPSSVRTDRVKKCDFYMRAPVGEYWVADPETRIIERWVKERQTPHVVRDVIVWRPPGASSELRIELSDVFGAGRTGIAAR